MHNPVDFQDVQALIGTLRVLYASQFNKQYPLSGPNAIPMQMIESVVVNSLVGVNKTQFNRGLALVNTSGKTFMPSFAEFRTLCIGQDWWNAEKAWVRACEYTKIMKHKKSKLADGVEQYQEITTIAKFALDQVILLINDGEMYRAKDEFMKLYTEYLAEAQLLGRMQQWYQEPVQLSWAGQESQAEHVPISKEDAKKKYAEFLEKWSQKNKVAVKPQELKPSPKPLNTPIINEWPDPFDDTEMYVSACDADGVSIPSRLCSQLCGGGV